MANSTLASLLPSWRTGLEPHAQHHCGCFGDAALTSNPVSHRARGDPELSGGFELAEADLAEGRA